MLRIVTQQEWQSHKEETRFHDRILCIKRESNH
uniref:Uncharacterized protein n=1 Tax=Rhizophora mucronata TaxID=61149 RepID=A0A2P2N5J8_RHIMU